LIHGLLNVVDADFLEVCQKKTKRMLSKRAYFAVGDYYFVKGAFAF
tara:strand:- start:87 stop:224 length:138 start_codon:yes stop_codon:yes gene_type:complete